VADHPEATWFKVSHKTTALQYQYAVCWHVAENAVFRLQVESTNLQIPNTEFWTISIVGLLDENMLNAA